MLIVGDWVPGKKSVDLALNSSSILSNLEGPIFSSDHVFLPMQKVGPSLFSNSLPKKECPFIFSLANNHFMDYGISGLEHSVTILDQKGFKFCGAGRDVFDARSPILVEEDNIKIGIIACCETQFGVARNNQAGVAEFGPWVYQTIRNLCKTVDAVIVSVHASVEDSPWPSPYIRELCKSFIDAGAKVVHGHHSHVPQGYERYCDGVIFFGMGNFAVDPDKWHDYPNGLWSLAAEIDLSIKPLRVRPFTLEIRHLSGSDKVLIEESSDEEFESHRQYLEICNLPLADDSLFESLWQEVSLRIYHRYGANYMNFYNPLHNSGRCIQTRTGLSMIKRALLSKFTPSYRPSKHNYLVWYHMIACESHRQMLTTALGILGGEIEDMRTEKSQQLVDQMIR